MKALVTNKDIDNNITVEVVNNFELPELTSNQTLIQINYSSINYKDALAITKKAPIAKTFPLVLGIDGVGTVIKTDSPNLTTGQQVFINGFSVGEKYNGCLAEYATLNNAWLLPIPTGLDAWQVMAIGTAGYTAALCVLKIISNVAKNSKVLVTGATGGVGSFTVMLLAKLGYRVVAATNKENNNDYLTLLGANEIVNSKELLVNKVLQKETWDAAIDTLGSSTLANICAQTKYEGHVVCCGLAQGMDLPTTVAPFILRSITLHGVDSVLVNLEKRQQAWQLLANYVDQAILTKIITTIKLDDVFTVANDMINANIHGRYVVEINNDK